MRSGRYVWIGPDGGVVDEAFDVTPNGLFHLNRKEKAKAGVLQWEGEIRFNEADWRVSEMRLSRLGPDGERESRYRWEGDCWAGQIVRAGSRSEVALPMSSGLEVIVAGPAFWGQFLRRAALPPLSQRRLEVLEIRLSDLEPVQSHRIVERLPDGPAPGSQAQAACYRWTDEQGSQEFVWVDAEHVTLARAERLDGKAFCRLG